MVALLIIDFGLGFVFGTDFYLELGLELEPSFTTGVYILPANLLTALKQSLSCLFFPSST